MKRRRHPVRCSGLQIPADLRPVVVALKRIDPCGIKILRAVLGTKPRDFKKLDRKLRELRRRGAVRLSVDEKNWFVPRQHGTHKNCARKTRFETSEDAQRYAARSEQITGSVTRTYVCPHCDGFHRTSSRASAL